MSRIGKKPIQIPTGVKVVLTDDILSVKGPKGEINLKIHQAIEVTIKDDQITVEPRRKNKEGRSLWGLFRTLIANTVKGVTDGFEKKLEFSGVGFRAQVQGNKLVLDVGFSHSVEVEAPKEISFLVEKNIITVSGIDKQLVGQVAAKVRAVKKPEPYKGTGIKYQGEKIRRKSGKKAVATAG